MPIYLGVNGTAREIKEKYTGVGGVARSLKEQYLGVNGIARLVFGRQYTGWTATITEDNTGAYSKGQVVTCTSNGTGINVNAMQATRSTGTKRFSADTNFRLQPGDVIKIQNYTTYDFSKNDSAESSVTVSDASGKVLLSADTVFSGTGTQSRSANPTVTLPNTYSPSNMKVSMAAEAPAVTGNSAEMDSQGIYVNDKCLFYQN